MLHLFDRATMAHALTLDLDPSLHRLLAARIASLKTEYGDLTDWTEFLVIEADDTEEDIIRHVGFSPLVDPISGRGTLIRYSGLVGTGFLCASIGLR